LSKHQGKPKLNEHQVKISKTSENRTGLKVQVNWLISGTF